MTKKQMAYEILSNTTFSGVDENQINILINKLRKEQVLKVYSQFLEDKERADYYFIVLFL